MNYSAYSTNGESRPIEIVAGIGNPSDEAVISAARALYPDCLRSVWMTDPRTGNSLKIYDAEKEQEARTQQDWNYVLKLLPGLPGAIIHVAREADRLEQLLAEARAQKIAPDEEQKDAATQTISWWSRIQAAKTTAMLQEADKKRRTLMIKAAEDAISGSIIDHKYFSRAVSLDQRLPREVAILIIQAIIDGKIPAVSMSFL